MTTLVLILWLLLALMLLFVTAMRPLRTKHSSFELKRKGDAAALDRERLLGDVYAYRRTVAVLLVMTLTIIGWVLLQERGVLIVLVGLPFLMLLSRWGVVERPAMQLYEGQERHLLGFAARWPTFGWLLGSDRHPKSDQRLESTEHLVHLVESAGHVLSEAQQKLIKRSLSWHTTTVSDVMTPAADIVTVPGRELLGPLVLDDLHKSGHHRFPVVHGDVDHIVGMVNITDLLRVDAIQKSQTAEKAMTPIDVRMSPDTTLPGALKSLSAHHGQLGLVVDDDKKTVGLVSLEDILKALLG
jgi:Mg2+/Co2+ transporter CorB